MGFNIPSSFANNNQSGDPADNNQSDDPAHSGLQNITDVHSWDEEDGRWQVDHDHVAGKEGVDPRRKVNFAGTVQVQEFHNMIGSLENHKLFTSDSEELSIPVVLRYLRRREEMCTRPPEWKF